HAREGTVSHPLPPLRAGAHSPDTAHAASAIWPDPFQQMNALLIRRRSLTVRLGLAGESVSRRRREELAMVTVVTRVRIKDRREAEWDEVFAKRVQAAREQEGFDFVQLCRPEDAARERVIVGTWETHDAWKTWHEDPAFLETRRELEEIDQESLRSH